MKCGGAVHAICRVDNEVLRTCHPSGHGEDRHCNDSDAKNDIGALCRHLLRAHGVHRQLKAALFVSKPRPSVHHILFSPPTKPMSLKIGVMTGSASGN